MSGGGGLLRSVLAYVPDENSPRCDPQDLNYVVSAVQTHRLLSESFSPSTQQHVIDDHKSAVDLWLKRILTLASSTMPDKCRAGIRLLGVTCQECCSERFLASYLDWFDKFIIYIQAPAETHILKAASCASLSDMLKRLSRYPNKKKDGNALATKIIRPILQLLNEDNSEVVWEEATCLLSTIVTAFPSSIQRHYDTVEAAVTLKLMSEKCSDSLLKKLGHVLSLLPKSRGDCESWMLMLQKILLLIDNQLQDAFQGLEEDSKRKKVNNLLLPPGKEPPQPLGGMVVQGVHFTKRPELLLMSRISTLIGCCCHLLTNPYPVQVLVPFRPLLALVERVLLVDGSSRRGLYPSAMNLETICSKLHLLHLSSLELLSSIIQGLRSLLLPHVAGIIQLLTVYFERCKLPEPRIKVYSIYRELLLSMGVGVAVYLAEVITGSPDLLLFNSEIGVLSSNVDSVSAEAQSQPYQKRRKHAGGSASPSLQSARVELDMDPALNFPTVSVKIAALEALEALLVVGGSFRSKDWRLDIDHFLAKVAENACKDFFVKEEQFSFPMGNTSTCTAFQLATLRAFKASLLSPGPLSPQYLAQGLELFDRGRRNGGPAVADFCAHSFLSLQALIRPKSLPLVNFHNYDPSREFPDKMYFNDHARNPVYHSTKFEKGQHEAVSDFDDPLQSLLQSDDEMENPLAGLNTVNWPLEACKISSSGNHAELSKMPEGSGAGVPAAVTAKRVATEQFGENYSPKAATASLVSGVETTHYSGIVHSRDDALSPITDMEVENNVLDYESGEKDKDSYMDKSKEIGFAMDNLSDVDSIPDIVDGDPDSE